MITRQRGARTQSILRRLLRACFSCAQEARSKDVGRGSARFLARFLLCFLCDFINFCWNTYVFYLSLTWLCLACNFSLLDTDTGKKKGFFSSLKRSKSKGGRGRKNAKSRSMPQLPQSYPQINGNLAAKRTDHFNISQPAKGGAEEDGAAPVPSATEAGGLTECAAQDVSPGSLVRKKPQFFVLQGVRGEIN